MRALFRFDRVAAWIRARSLYSKIPLLPHGETSANLVGSTPKPPIEGGFGVWPFSCFFAIIYTMKKYAIILLALGLATHFIFIWQPAETVFDEVHFGKFISGYYTHEYFFDIHPPLGKLMIAGFAKIVNFEPGFSFANIGDKFPDNKYVALRFLPNLAGAFLPLVIYLLALRLGIEKRASFFAGLFVALENALLVQSHYILMDAFLLLFGFVSLYFYFSYRESKKWQSLLWMGIFGGLSASVKWTGLSFLALAGIIKLIDLIKRRHDAIRYSLFAISFILIPFLIYFSLFALHFKLLYKSGPGDAFMMPEFRKTLIGSQDYDNADIKPANLWQKFIGLNREMYRSNQRLSATHPYGSQWYSWPFMTRPIYYWVQDNARIYLIGNPVIWWASTAAVLLLTLRGFLEGLRKDKIALILLGGYALNMLPFIGVARVMFLYHYFTALIFAILMLAYLISGQKTAKKFFLAVTTVAVTAFVYFAPLSYGLTLSSKAYDIRVWFSSWR
ncbi:MAG: hypothetical protein A2750_04160 [Candidatus Yanofskybacteria bacterium RIFCSPHIGHO2_01_FULL_45_42]|uniref:Polyprenol-phosphate-mannose--protein mannosyltransferase n=2 Tax=Candidatus Yanofskyibacteriota TaxID=1752733 RepID=A0A1F8EZ21_9BACT|nr:MAG: hypothetical protein A2750_04160 [Candidatus Yanofskybacteria bacterium RIFCSPHIGHO2_01_FULL_45_42]